MSRTLTCKAKPISGMRATCSSKLETAIRVGPNKPDSIQFMHIKFRRYDKFTVSDARRRCSVHSAAHAATAESYFIIYSLNEIYIQRIHTHTKDTLRTWHEHKSFVRLKYKKIYYLNCKLFKMLWRYVFFSSLNGFGLLFSISVYLALARRFVAALIVALFFFAVRREWSCLYMIILSFFFCWSFLFFGSHMALYGFSSCGFIVIDLLKCFVSRAHARQESTQLIEGRRQRFLIFGQNRSSLLFCISLLRLPAKKRKEN